MLVIEKDNHIFTTKRVWFSDYPYDIDGCDRVVFCDCKNESDVDGFHCRRQASTLVIDLTQELDAIWESMSRGSCRQPIAQAQKEGVNIRINQDYDEFYDMYRSVVKAKGLSGLKQLEFIKKHGTVFVAEFHGQIISGICYLEDKDNIRALVAGSMRFECDAAFSKRVAGASKLIVWRAINYAKAKGIKELDMGGYYTGAAENEQKQNINIFKRRFGGELATRYVYQKDYSKIAKLAEKALRLRRRIFQCEAC